MTHLGVLGGEKQGLNEGGSSGRNGFMRSPSPCFLLLHAPAHRIPGHLWVGRWC